MISEYPLVIFYDLTFNLASEYLGGSMNKKYKAVVFAPAIAPEKSGIRYAIMDMESGEIVDDAQGYGYKSAQKAYAGWAYKSRDKSRDNEKAEKEIIISRWMKENKGFIRLLDTLAFEIAKGSHAPEDKVDAGFIRKLLKENGYTDLPFTAGELYKYWQRGPVFSKRKRK